MAASDHLGTSTYGFVVAVGALGAAAGLLGAANSYDLGSGAALALALVPIGVASLLFTGALAPRAPRSGSPTARSASPTCDSSELGVSYVRSSTHNNPSNGVDAAAPPVPTRFPAEAAPDGYRELAMVSVIGRGRLGSAALLFSSAPGGGRQQVVGKRLVLDEARDDAAAVFAEVVALRNLPRHPHVVACVASFQAPEDGALWLLLRHAGGGTLKQAIRKQAGRAGGFATPLVARWLYQLARGLAHLHGHGRLHGDLSAQAILLAEDASIMIGDPALTSLGASAQPALPGATMATPLYMSPEAMRGEAHAAPSDVWAVGVICFELLTRRRPFDGSLDGGGSAAEAEEAHAPPAARTVADELKTLKRRILAADVTLSFEPQAALDSCGHPPALCALPLQLLQVEVSARMTLEQMIDALEPEQPPADWSAGPGFGAAALQERASAPPSVAGRPPNAPLLPKRFDDNVAQTQPITARELTEAQRAAVADARAAASADGDTYAPLFTMSWTTRHSPNCSPSGPFSQSARACAPAAAP